jgi:hypothetical protein
MTLNTNIGVDNKGMGPIENDGGTGGVAINVVEDSPHGKHLKSDGQENSNFVTM